MKKNEVVTWIRDGYVGGPDFSFYDRLKPPEVVHGEVTSVFLGSVNVKPSDKGPAMRGLSVSLLNPTDEAVRHVKEQWLARVQQAYGRRADSERRYLDGLEAEVARYKAKLAAMAEAVERAKAEVGS